MCHQVAVDLLGIQRAAGLGQVVDRPIGRQAEREPDVAELQVEVDDGHPLTGCRQGDGQVARGQRLARSTLRPQHADHRRGGHGSRRGAVAAGEHLLDRELHALPALRDADDVVCAGLEHPPDEPVGAARVEHHHGPVRLLLHGAVDQEQRLVGVAVAGDHEQLGGGLLDHAPARPRSPRPRRRAAPLPPADAGLQHPRVDTLFEDDKRLDRGCHQPPPFRARWYRRL